MRGRICWPLLLGLAGLFAVTGGKAEAAVVRFHYLPGDATANLTLQPANNGLGERVRWFGAAREPYHTPLRPTHVVTFLHPYTGRQVSVPVALPEGTPNIRHGSDRITFDYGSYTVTAQFFPDGSVDVLYNSGFLREP
jgi:hypothetical protein